MAKEIMEIFSHIEAVRIIFAMSLAWLYSQQRDPVNFRKNRYYEDSNQFFTATEKKIQFDSESIIK